MAYPGGKGGAGVYQTIINQMPPHDIYIEAFLGGASVMRHKRPAAANIGLDRDADVCDARRRDLSWMRYTIVQADALRYLARWKHWTGRELVYADPPYLFSGRKCGRTPRYGHELGDVDQHLALLRILKRLPCMVMVSTYPSKVYTRELGGAGWRCVVYQSVTRSGKQATEHLWCNFPEPRALHDYRYLGADFRERERIKRKATRWRGKLDRLPALEQLAVLTACLAPTIKLGVDRSSADPAIPAIVTPGGIAGTGEVGRQQQHRRKRRGPPARLAKNGDTRSRSAMLGG